MPTRDFTYHPSFRRYYLRTDENEGCVTSSEDEADTVVIETRHGAYRTELSFPWPSGRTQAGLLTNMLQTAFDHGWQNALGSVREALGVKEPRP